jgi:hypothetical protein
LARAVLPAAGLLLMAGLWPACPPAAAQRAPLKADEQAAVDRAIERGVTALKDLQGPLGTWAPANGTHPLGYAALPGLTLLECGVPASDARLQRTARLVRRLAARAESTYEIALAVLFLDRLGDARDEDLIATLATRLIVGQTITGGWGYKCPLIGKQTQKDILTALRKLDPQPGFAVPVRRDGPPQQGAVAADPGPLAGAVGQNPAGGGPDQGVVGPTGGSLLDGAKGDPRGPGKEGTPTGAKGPGGEGKPGAGEAPASGLSRRWARCIKSADWDFGPRGAPASSEPPARLEDVVPRKLRLLPVFRKGMEGLLVDPPGRDQEGVAATTDNSNTQFAMLALWAAGRHDVPMKRSLDLLVRRFRTSQNDNGSWGYRYRLGGGEAEGAATTAVGLLGLAIGHGVAGRPAAKKVIDPAVLKGLVALSKYVGKATGGLAVKQENLYVLWSIERVAVLYDLPTIAEKDWYRWAAEMLVLNQQPLGHWQGGGYHGATPVIDTCFALLVLKRANLASDLSSRLPYSGGSIEKAVKGETQPPPPTTKPAASKRPPAALTAPEAPAAAPTPPPAPAPAPASPVSQPAVVESGRGPMFWVLLGTAGLVLLGGLGCVLFAVCSGKDEEEEEKKPARRKPQGARRKPKRAAT